MGFNRLRINDLSPNADMPMRRNDVSMVANAEIYNYKALQLKYGFKFTTDSDCEILLHLYEKFGNVIDFVNELDGVFAFLIHDHKTGVTHVGRDPIGVRPIFMGKDVSGNYAFASEAKTLLNVCRNTSIQQFKPGHIWNSESHSYTKWY